MWTKQRRATKHPVQERLLPVPGESLQDELLDRAFNTAVFWGMTITLMACLLLLEWWRWFTQAPPTPIVTTVLTVPVIAYSGYRIWRGVREIEPLRVGLKGERAVGQFLQQELPLLGYTVLHDVPGEGFNIDHVAIGPGGVFSIETKTISKPAKGNPVIEYDGKSVKVDGFTPDRDPVAQAAAGARFIAQMLYQQTGNRSSVQPIVVYPGWWVQRSVPRPEVWVLNSKEVPGYIGHERLRLSPSEVRAAVEGLKRHIRSKIESQ